MKDKRVVQDLHAVRQRCGNIYRALDSIATKHLEDLYELAYGQNVSDEVKVQDSRKGVDDLVPKARGVWEDIVKAVKEADDRLVGVEYKLVGILELKREQSVPTLPGALVTRSEFDEARSRQRERAARGEYVPKRSVKQPKY